MSQVKRWDVKQKTGSRGFVTKRQTNTLSLVYGGEEIFEFGEFDFDFDRDDPKGCLGYWLEQAEALADHLNTLGFKR